MIHICTVASKCHQVVHLTDKRDCRCSSSAALNYVRRKWLKIVASKLDVLPKVSRRHAIKTWHSTAAKWDWIITLVISAPGIAAREQERRYMKGFRWVPPDCGNVHTQYICTNVCGLKRAKEKSLEYLNILSHICFKWRVATLHHPEYNICYLTLFSLIHISVCSWCWCL